MKTKEMYPTLEIITPNIAREWIAHNTDNRRIRTTHVANIVLQIEQGEYMLTHQAIAFTGDKSDPVRLIDGQHTLTAIAKSGATLKKWVFWNCDDSTYAVIDGGVTRSFADHHGWGKNDIAVTQFYHRLITGIGSKMTKTNADSIFYVIGEYHTRLIKSCATTKKGITSAAIRAGVIYAMLRNKDHVDLICEHYRNMVLENIHQLPASISRFYIKMKQARYKGDEGAKYQFAIAAKCFSPENYGLTKIYLDVTELTNNAKAWVKSSME